MNPKEVLEFAKTNNAKQVDLRFTDLPGLQQHVSYPIGMLQEDSFEDGFGFDGSSIRGWQAISESDMLIMPDPDAIFMDPFTDVPTLVIVCNVVDPLTKQHYERDPQCSSWRDSSESESVYECNDGVDNDDDGLTDFGGDPDLVPFKVNNSVMPFVPTPSASAGNAAIGIAAA